VPSVPAPDIDDLITSLDALYYLKHQSDTSASEFSEQVLQAMDDSGNKALLVEKSLRESFKERLNQVMSGNLLSVAIKSREVLYEQERTFGFARVLSDVRLLDEEGSEDDVNGAVIIHTLKIHYIENDQHKEFFVSLDTADVDVLIDALISAQERAKSLKAMLAAANVLYIDAE
jgi:hypothetical protein